jgi:hypothetical protein
MVESLLREYPNVLTLRVRMPIVADMTYPRNFITKIIKYDKVINIPNSMTVLPELLPYSIEMVRRRRTAACAHLIGLLWWSDMVIVTRAQLASMRSSCVPLPCLILTLTSRMLLWLAAAGQAQADGHHELHQPGRG